MYPSHPWAGAPHLLKKDQCRNTWSGNYREVGKQISTPIQNKELNHIYYSNSYLMDIPISSTSWADISVGTWTKTFWLFWVAFCAHITLLVNVLAGVEARKVTRSTYMQYHNLLKYIFAGELRFLPLSLLQQHNKLSLVFQAL